MRSSAVIRRDRKESGRSANSVRVSAISSSSRPRCRCGSPTPVRSHASFTPNSRHISEIVRSLGARPPVSTKLMKFFVNPIRSANSVCDNPACFRISFILSFKFFSPLSSL
nr:MAG TPA: hypothetical protein [Caudoviricetes sp.]